MLQKGRINVLGQSRVTLDLPVFGYRSLASFKGKWGGRVA